VPEPGSDQHIIMIRFGCRRIDFPALLLGRHLFIPLWTTFPSVAEKSAPNNFLVVQVS
jgi:hypothetical protein